MTQRHITLDFDQKSLVRTEFERRPWIYKGVEYKLANWARHEFKLNKAPSRRTMKRILKTSSIDNVPSTFKKIRKSYRNRPPKYPEVERRLSAWVRDMFIKQTNVADWLLCEKAQEIINECNEVCERTAKIDFKLSQGWLWRFKKRNGFKSYKSHGESAGVNDGITYDKMKRILAESNR